MKKAMLVLVLMFSMSAAQATPAVIFVAGMLTGGLISSDINHEDKFKTVTAAHASNPNGYTFDLTKFEYDRNPSAYVLK